MRLKSKLLFRHVENMMINQCNFTKKSQMVFCLFDGTQKI